MSVNVLPGVCSVTFRELAPAQVIDLASEAELAGIEWGGDVHLPPGDAAAAQALGEQSAQAGLACPSYGSYWFAGFGSLDDAKAALETTKAVGASTIRVWTQFGVESDAPAEERTRITHSLAEMVALAAEHHIRVGMEFHPGTLTHTAASTSQLLRDVDNEALFTYWQPEPGAQFERAVSEFRSVQGEIAHVHVFSWDPDGEHRRPLDHFEDTWSTVLNEVHEVGRWGADRFAYLEFVADDDPARFREDAATLRRWLGAAT